MNRWELHEAEVRIGAAIVMLGHGLDDGSLLVECAEQALVLLAQAESWLRRAA